MNRVENSMIGTETERLRVFPRPKPDGVREIFLVTFAVRNFLRRLGMPMVCVAMFSLVGGHWAIFQTIAWTQMLRDYSRNATVAEALEKTFSGKAPCAMCCTIVKEKQKEEKAPATIKLEKKAEIFAGVPQNLLPPPLELGSHRFSVRPFSGPLRSDRPPLPVPKFPA